MDKNLLGRRVRQIRRAKKLTQGDLADAINLSTGSVSNIERGATYPTLNTLNDIAKALRVPIGDFFVFLDEPRLKDARRSDMASLMAAARDLDDELLKITLQYVQALASRK